ncbi:alpha-xylosidase [Paenibacillus sp. FSL R7-0337]|uniref:alpha-xylosidase n=1 Tax=Paenibacillus sp. FSL R7-0337 TaxID=1926588 RepID=UPI00096DA6AA|nr:alpha-xylosidase [Paenibacillus sp. FSL R7-0337]OMF98463.1 alpha-xylosidase [Paenibacillus sp. FSL R7-0337]
MKFSDGIWMTREGFSIISPSHVFETENKQNQLMLLVAPRKIDQRGSQMDTPIFTVKFTSPLEDVICVRISHFEGDRMNGPNFEINKNSQVETQINDSLKEVILKSGELSVRVQKEGLFSFEFFNKDELLTRSTPKSIGYVNSKESTYLKEELDIAVGECIYGLGERFTSFVKNGQTVEIWNNDGGTNTDQAYKNIPLYLTNKGYGVLVNHPEKVSFEVGSEKVSKVQFSVPGEYLEYFIINGPSLKNVLERYTTLTGKPSLPPAWSFGLWLSTSFTTNYDEDTVNTFIDGMKARDLPLQVFHFDCFWMKSMNWCDFEWDKNVFPEPQNMLNRLKNRGLKISLWINPYISQFSRLFQEGVEEGYFIKRKDGSVWRTDKWQPGMAIVDFTNPKACQWYSNHLITLLDMGVDSFKTDFGERIPTEDIVYYDGSDTYKMHNYYSYLYNKVVFEVLENRLGKGQAVLYARTATVGSQKFPIHWGGDCFSTFEAMAESLRGGLSLSLSGFGFWSHDIGGFGSTSTADVYKRWTAFGLLSTHSRLHGNHSYRVPWIFDEEAVEVMRFFTNWKCKLMPYLYRAAIETSVFGVPLLRPMILEFMEDPACNYLDQQYMLGDNLLIAPIMREDGKVKFYLPYGNWTHLFTGEKIAGGRWVEQEYDYMGLPLYVRPNTILPIGSSDCRTEYNYADKVELHVFELEELSDITSVISTSINETSLTISLKRNYNKIEIHVASKYDTWSIILREINSFKEIKNALWERTPLGLRIAPLDPNHIIELII